MRQELLKNKTIKGVGWSAADAFLGQGVTFNVLFIMQVTILTKNIDF